MSFIAAALGMPLLEMPGHVVFARVQLGALLHGSPTKWARRWRQFSVRHITATEFGENTAKRQPRKKIDLIGRSTTSSISRTIA